MFGVITNQKMGLSCLGNDVLIGDGGTILLQVSPCCCFFFFFFFLVVLLCCVVLCCLGEITNEKIGLSWGMLFLFFLLFLLFIIVYYCLLLLFCCLRNGILIGLGDPILLRWLSFVFVVWV